MDSQEILLGYAIFASSEYCYHGYRCIARSISNKKRYINVLAYLLTYFFTLLFCFFARPIPWHLPQNVADKF